MLKYLIIFTVILLTQRSCAEIDRDLSNICLEERNAQSKIAKNCEKHVPDISELVSEMQATISQGGDENQNHIKWYSKKICSSFDRALHCRSYYSDFGEQCLSYYHNVVASERTFLNTSHAVLDYVCQSEGQIFLDIAQNDVKDVLTDVLRNCEFRKQAFEEPDAWKFRVNPAFCESLQELFVCYADLVNNHQNQNLRRIVRELYDIVSSELQC